VTVAPAHDISAAANAMVEQRLHRVLVTDAGGALVGILSALDLAALLIDADV
jgi:CBS domain-containing protein